MIRGNRYDVRTWADKGIELAVNLQVAIINLISQIPMSIWLCNDGRIVVASTVANEAQGDGLSGDASSSL